MKSQQLKTLKSSKDMEKKVLFSIIFIGILVLGAFLFINFNEEEEVDVKYIKNDCDIHAYRYESIESAVNRYEKLDCFDGNYMIYSKLNSKELHSIDAEE
jgi:hypothetical protein